MKKKLVVGFLLLGIIIAGMFSIECYNRYNNFRSGDLEYICSHINFDTNDDKFPVVIQTYIHIFRDLDLSCGSTSHLVQNYLSYANIPSRKVVLLTTHEWNYYNNGHTMLEVYKNNKWQIYDVSKDVYFTSKEDFPLSFIELYERIPTNNYKIKSITGINFNETKMRNELNYVKDIPYIISDTRVFFVPSGDYGGKEIQYWKAMVVVMSKDEFNNTFYKTNPSKEVFCDVF